MPNIMPLIDLAKNVMSLLDDADNEITPEVSALLAELEQKGIACVAPLCDVVDELKARSNARKEKAAELSALAAKDLQMMENAKKLIIKVMQVAGVDKLDNGALKVTLAKGRESLEVTDESLIPDSYKKLTVVLPGAQAEFVKDVLGESIIKMDMVIDKTAIKKVTDENIGVAGTQIVRNPYLIIKG